MGRHRSTVEWDERRDRLVVKDIRRFKGRAIGDRLRQLAAMGLEAERLGMRVEQMPDGQFVPVSDRMNIDFRPAATAGSPPARPVSAGTEISEEHRAGLLNLLDSIDCA